MKAQNLRSNLILLLAAAIWGSSFVFQRMASEHIGAFTFNGLRFAIGSISLLPLILVNDRKKNAAAASPERRTQESALIPGMLAGTMIFVAAWLQQLGLAYTTAGKAAFITGLYIVLVPVFGIFLKQKIGAGTWLGIALAVAGLYLLSVTDNFSIQKGDLYELIGSFFWTVQILIIDRFSKRVDVLKLSCIQFVAASALSIAAALMFENIYTDSIRKAVIPILYIGIFSTGVAYTLQAIGQKHTKPSHAAIILSMETVFGSLGGLIVLGEYMGVRGYAGCILMLSGMILSQLQDAKKSEDYNPPAIQVPKEV